MKKMVSSVLSGQMNFGKNECLIFPLEKEQIILFTYLWLDRITNKKVNIFNRLEMSD
eukprot:c33631_g1_i1 orf=219-389(+)